ncbi:ABC-type transport system involved in multi-copper enzyme maturation, permease component [Thermoplasmatales archaeon SCGC AB-539-N05]|nr:ABC-type transport system involved in multi-copper enzyme maturation, permease component [Thermoplasmatales archaeon SCGC AB-539-N05]
MTNINPKAIFTIAKKEFLDNIRNKWIIVLTVIFVLLVIVFSYVAGGQTGGEETFGGMQNTVLGLISISSLLIPLIALILGFSTISGEAESGALYVVLSYPVRRIEILLGKLLGLGSVIVVSVFLGFGLGGIAIAATVGPESWAGYIGFMLLSIFMGFIYLSLSICISAYCKRRITSIGGVLLVFFWGMIYGTVFLAILYATGSSIEDFLTGNIPDWFFNSVVFSPGDLHQTAVMRVFGMETIDAMGISVTIPEFLSMNFLLVVHIIWFIVPLFLAYFFFKRRDI